MISEKELAKMKENVQRELVYYWGVYLYSVQYGQSDEYLNPKPQKAGQLVGVDDEADQREIEDNIIVSDVKHFRRSIFSQQHAIQPKWYQKFKENFCWHALNPFFYLYKDYYKKSSEDKIQKLLILAKILNAIEVKEYSDYLAIRPAPLSDGQKKENKSLVQELSSQILYEWVSGVLGIVSSSITLLTSVFYRINLAIQGEKPDAYFFSKDYFKDLGLWFLESLSKITLIYSIVYCISQQPSLNKIIDTLEKQSISIPKDLTLNI